MSLPKKPREGLVRFWCRYCKRNVVDTFPSATVWCPKGHKCKAVGP